MLLLLLLPSEGYLRTVAFALELVCRSATPLLCAPPLKVFAVSFPRPRRARRTSPTAAQISASPGVGRLVRSRRTCAR